MSFRSVITAAIALGVLALVSRHEAAPDESQSGNPRPTQETAAVREEIGKSD